MTATQIARAGNRYVLYSRTDVANPSVWPLYQDEAGTLPTIATTTTGNDNNKGNRMYIALKKFDDLTGSIIRDLGSRDAFVFRLSEMYLIAAEGYMMTNQSAGAIQKLNDLRNARAIAGQSNVLTSAEESQVSAKDINVILDERARELCGEQQRWFDLKRTGKLLPNMYYCITELQKTTFSLSMFCVPFLSRNSMQSQTEQPVQIRMDLAKFGILVR